MHMHSHPCACFQLLIDTAFFRLASVLSPLPPSTSGSSSFSFSSRVLILSELIEFSYSVRKLTGSLWKERSAVERIIDISGQSCSTVAECGSLTVKHSRSLSCIPHFLLREGILSLFLANGGAPTVQTFVRNTKVVMIQWHIKLLNQISNYIWPLACRRVTQQHHLRHLSIDNAILHQCLDTR